jgi:hypothetical protein
LYENSIRRPNSWSQIPYDLDFETYVDDTLSDSAAPDTNITGGLDGPTNDDTPTFTFSGSDDVTSSENLKYAYKVDNGNWSSPSSDTSVTLPSQTEDTHTFYVKAIDEAGNEDDTPAEQSFTVDKTPPTISGTPTSALTAKATRASGGEVAIPNITAEDAVDGAVNVSCESPASDVSPNSSQTFPLGKTTVNCEAIDAANNKASASFDVNVTYSWSGILQPINGGTTLNNKTDDTSAFKLGSTVPVKFKLTGDSAAINNAKANIVVTKLDGTPDGSVVEATSTNAPDSGSLFRYDSAGAQYIFNWGTKGLGAGDYLIKIDLGDGTTATNAVKVSLKK